MVGDTGVVGPSSNPSPTPSFTLADLFAGDLSSTSHAINNLQALAKLGNTLGNQGEELSTLLRCCNEFAFAFAFFEPCNL